MVTAGIDAGNKRIKAVLLGDAGVMAFASSSGGYALRDSAEALFGELLTAAGLKREEVRHITATGMGRDLVDFAASRVTDVTAAARAAAYLLPGVATIVEVGAEESRAVRTDGAGRVLDSSVNEKCAAGSGSFTESMARALGLTLEEFGAKSLDSTEKIDMNAQCTVFAESEVVSLIHNSVKESDIARAVHDAIASRVSSQVRRVGIAGEVALFGGMAKNPGFVKSLEEALGVEGISIPEEPDFADALGAALIAADRALKEAPGE
ncbi:MAG: CoA activase [Deltaproteobacteria bacterium]|nr:MAG: CoA activase [Deltaproteobacteria bacterium]